jgi:radical SAM superfamily enzyme YgiQ (UPF0313 family)
MVEIVRDQTTKNPKEVIVYHPQSPMLEKEGVVPPLAAVKLGTILSERGHNVTVIDDHGQNIETHRLMDCDIVLFAGVTTPQYPQAREKLHSILEAAKGGKKKPFTGIGGAHPTYSTSLLEDGWDFVCSGWGDKIVGPLVEGDITDRMKVGEIPSEDFLNAVPLPNFNLIDRGINSYKRTEGHNVTLPVMTSVGCPHDCSFCANALWKRKVRFYSPERVIAMYKSIKDADVHQVVVYDDDALINKDGRVQKISEGIQNMDMLWRCNTHVNTIENKRAIKLGILPAIRDAGCALVALGIDGPDQENLDYFNKGTTIDKCYRGIAQVKKNGMLAKVYMIYRPGGGLPYAEKMTSFCEKTKPDFIQFSVMVPMPGSDMYNDPEKYGLSFDQKNFGEYYYCGKGGQRGNVGLLGDKDVEALHFLDDFSDKFKRNSPKMPV